MRGCFKFDENPAVVSLPADLTSYCICSLGCAKVSRMHGSEYGAFCARRRLDGRISRVTQAPPNGKNSTFKCFSLSETYIS